MNDADLDDSMVVDIVTWVLYLGWLSVLASGALWIGIEPMPTIVDAFDARWQGNLAAVGAGVAFIAVSRVVYEKMKARYEAPSP